MEVAGIDVDIIFFAGRTELLLIEGFDNNREEDNSVQFCDLGDN